MTLKQLIDIMDFHWATEFFLYDCENQCSQYHGMQSAIEMQELGDDKILNREVLQISTDDIEEYPYIYIGKENPNTKDFFTLEDLSRGLYAFEGECSSCTIVSPQEEYDALDWEYWDMDIAKQRQQEKEKRLLESSDEELYFEDEVAENMELYLSYLQNKVKRFAIMDEDYCTVVTFYLE